jgi:hypothetical protein
MHAFYSSYCTASLLASLPAALSVSVLVSAAEIIQAQVSVKYGLLVANRADQDICLPAIPVLAELTRQNTTAAN